MTQCQVIAVDGKELRGPYGRCDNKAAIHLVSAWACAQGVTLGQIKVTDKSNEIPAIPQLLEVLHVSRCIVATEAALSVPCHNEHLLLRFFDTASE